MCITNTYTSCSVFAFITQSKISNCSMHLLQVMLRCQRWQAKPTLIPSGVRFHHLLPQTHSWMSCMHIWTATHWESVQYSEQQLPTYWCCFSPELHHQRPSEPVCPDPTATGLLPLPFSDCLLPVKQSIPSFCSTYVVFDIPMVYINLQLDVCLGMPHIFLTSRIIG